MERSKFTKILVVSAVSLATGGFLLSSLLGLVDLARSPAPVKNAPSSQKKEPKNPTALQGMETVVRYYLQTGDKPKTIQALEKLLAAAPQAKNAQEYTKLLKELKNPASPSPSAK
jgi:hypothetical protein